MCLARKGRFKVKTNYGWKVLIETDHQEWPLMSPYYSWYSYNVGEWYEDRPGTWRTVLYEGYSPHDYYRRSPDDYRYQLGYHIFLNEGDAKEYADRMSGSSVRYVVRKVEFDEVVATGYQEYKNKRGKYPCVVARRMRILPEETGQEGDKGDSGRS